MAMSRRMLVVVLAALVVAVSGARAGGISDEPCPNVAGEHTNTCPAATLGVPYHVRFRETEGSGCGPGRQTFHLDSGALPAGLTLSPDGALNGTPLAPGRFQFYVQMREPANDPATCAGKRTEKQFTLWVRRPLSVMPRPEVPPRSEVGVPFAMTFRGRGGSGHYAWRWVGKTPPGIRLASSGTLRGIPRAAGVYVLELRVRDTEARVAVWRGTLAIAPRLVVRTAPIPLGRVGQRYAVPVRAAGGVPPRTWTLRQGRLPRGLRLLPSGRVVGTPRDAGRYNVVVRVRDDLGASAVATLAITVRARP
jgi:large repetitive protein